MARYEALSNAPSRGTYDPNLVLLPPPSLVVGGRLSAPPQLRFRRRRIPTPTKLFALIVLLVVFWALGHFLMSKLMPVQATVRIPQSITTPTSQNYAPAAGASTAYPRGSVTGRSLVWPSSSGSAGPDHRLIVKLRE